MRPVYVPQDNAFRCLLLLKCLDVTGCAVVIVGTLPRVPRNSGDGCSGRADGHANARESKKTHTHICILEHILELEQ